MQTIAMTIKVNVKQGPRGIWGAERGDEDAEGGVAVVEGVGDMAEETQEGRSRGSVVHIVPVSQPSGKVSASGSGWQSGASPVSFLILKLGP